jgi:hypothetical protein
LIKEKWNNENNETVRPFSNVTPQVKVKITEGKRKVYHAQIKKANTNSVPRSFFKNHFLKKR